MKKKKISSSWTEYFNFSTRERRGAIFLSCIILVQIGVLFFLRNNSKPFPFPDSKKIIAILKSKEENISGKKFSETIEYTPEKSHTLFNFDPNNLDDKSWLQLGLSEKKIKVIKNYLSHGGKFRVKSDFEKMYCISKDEYGELKPFLLLPDSLQRTFTEYKKQVRKIEIIDVQLADSASFEKLRGIGAVLASRIVRYREKLGGFYSMEQLKEVYGINDSLFQSLSGNLILEKAIPFRFVHLNTDSFDVLASHPYIKTKIAGLICSFRKQHQSFSRVDQLRQLPLITEENFLKLAPYLTTE